MARQKYKKLYTADDCSTHVWALVKDARENVEFTLKLDAAFIQDSRRGVPWKCLLANGTAAIAHSGHNPFSHPVKFVYVEGSHLYVLTRVSGRNRREYPLAMRYRHNFTKTLRQFDNMTKAQFVELFGDAGVQIRLKPPIRHQRSAEQTESRQQPARAPSTERRLVGAMRRARDAGLLNLEHLGGPSPATAA
jgi:hypothetical protein